MSGIWGLVSKTHSVPLHHASHNYSHLESYVFTRSGIRYAQDVIGKRIFFRAFYSDESEFSCFKEGHLSAAILCGSLGPHSIELKRILRKPQADSLWDLKGGFTLCVEEALRTDIICDRFGISTAYWAEDAEKVVFSSSAFFVSCVMDSTPKGTEGLFVHLMLRGQMTGQSYFDNIYSLMPGHCLRISEDGTVSSSKILNHAQISTSDFNFSEVLRRQIPVNSSVMLSGGIDSSVIARETAEKFNKQLKCYSLISPSDKRLELDWGHALLMGKHFSNIDNIGVEFELEPIQCNNLDNPVLDQDEYGLQCIINRLTETEITLLTGDGADELFGGYDRIIKYMKMSGKIDSEAFIAMFLNKYFYTPTMVLSETNTVLVDMLLNQLKSYYQSITDFDPNYPLRSIQKWFLRQHLFWILRSCANSGCHKIVHPFLQNPILDYALKLNEDEWAPFLESDINSEEYHCNVKKILKKQYVGILPPEILKRPKLAFPVQYNELSAFYMHNFETSCPEKLLNPQSEQKILSGRYGENAKLQYLSYTLWRQLCKEKKSQLLS